MTLLLDQSAPSLSAVLLSTNNAFVAGPATPAYAITGNTVTLAITASESLRTLSATIGGKTATVSGSGASWTATVTMTSSDNESSSLDTDSDGTSDFAVKYEDLSIDPQSGSQSGDIAETNVKYDDVTVGQWSHVTVAYDGTNMIVYGNGVLKQTISGGVTAFDRFKVGMNRNGGKYFDGGFDELRIYGQALSAEEVAILYNSETSN
ncbi:MAG: LamG domain-containing protein [SAR324 cluster bacterium]|nr:LamG domain-containing protein [SAR324 cluster bacterium]